MKKQFIEFYSTTKMRKVCAYWVPGLLTKEYHQKRKLLSTVDKKKVFLKIYFDHCSIKPAFKLVLLHDMPKEF